MQVIFALPPTGNTDLTMRIYNSDGSEPEMCGNGIRCLARFVADTDKAQPRSYNIHTLAGLFATPVAHLACFYGIQRRSAAWCAQHNGLVMPCPVTVLARNS